MKYTTRYLKQLLTENEIKFTERSSKSKLLFQLFDAGILTCEEVSPMKPMDPKYEHLRTLRMNPKKVTYTDMETGETITYDSINQASKARGHGHIFYLKRNRRDGKFTVTVE